TPDDSIRFKCLKHSVGLQIYVIRFVPEFPTFHHQSPCGATLWLELREKDGGGVKLQTVKVVFLLKYFGFLTSPCSFATVLYK
ncbi:hypothetical protein Tco_0675739, partial [Tanacetum coccineum]